MAGLPRAMPVGTAAAVGAAGGFLARQDANDLSRATQMSRQRSLWLEAGALIGGLFLGNQARTPNQTDVADGLTYSGAALLTRRAGVMAAQAQETPTPAPVTTVPQASGLAAGQTFGSIGAGQFVAGASRRLVTQRQNVFV